MPAESQHALRRRMSGRRNGQRLRTPERFHAIKAQDLTKCRGRWHGACMHNERCMPDFRGRCHQRPRECSHARVNRPGLLSRNLPIGLQQCGMQGVFTPVDQQAGFDEFLNKHLMP